MGGMPAGAILALADIEPGRGQCAWRLSCAPAARVPMSRRAPARRLQLSGRLSPAGTRRGPSRRGAGAGRQRLACRSNSAAGADPAHTTGRGPPATDRCPCAATRAHPCGSDICAEGARESPLRAHQQRKCKCLVGFGLARRRSTRPGRTTLPTEDNAETPVAHGAGGVGGGWGRGRRGGARAVRVASRKW